MEPSPSGNYVTVDTLIKCGRYPFTEGQMRFLLMRRHKNGLEQAIIKVGKRVYVRIDLFDAWLEAQRKERR